MASRTLSITNSLYYTLKPIIPRWLQIEIRRQALCCKRMFVKKIWPIDNNASAAPEGWGGWPEGKKFAVVLTHDVDTARGHERCHRLAQVERALGFRSSFNFVARRYPVSAELRQTLVGQGFEVGVHGLYHDGKKYRSREIFLERAAGINHYLREWEAVGFRSPAMHHNLDWFHDLDIHYDASTFDTDPFEPQSDGVRTIFPFFVRHPRNGHGYVELPYTLPQDFTLFILMKERSIDIWKRKLDWLAEKGGMALVVTHPDYMWFGDGRCSLEEYPIRYYEEFLGYIQTRYKNQYWHVLPRRMATYWTNGALATRPSR